MNLTHSQLAEPENPYQAGLSVGATSAFVGRTAILEKVNRLMVSRQNVVVLFGQRRIGKTSILMELRERLRLFGAETLLFDLSGKSSKLLDDIVALLCSDLCKLLNIPAPESIHADFFKDVWLPEVLSNLEPEKRIVFLFDEFEALPADQHRNESHPFYSYIKELIEQQDPRLFFILTVGRNALDINKVSQGVFKGAVHIEVSLLSERETHELVAFSETNGTLQWSEEARNQVYKLTNGHPYLTQRLCSNIWEECYSSEYGSLVREHRVIEAVSETLKDSLHMFDWLWDGLTPVGRVIAAALASQSRHTITTSELQKALFESGVEELGFELFSATKLLQDLGLVEVVPSTDVNDKNYRFRVELLRRWIKYNKELPTVQLELERRDDNAELHYKLALRKYQEILKSSEEQPDNRSYRTPIRHLQDALESNQNHGRAIELLAIIYASVGRLGEAQELFARFARLRPEQGRPKLVRILLERASKTQGGEEKYQLLQQAYSLSPKSPKYRHDLRRNAREEYQRQLALNEHRLAFRFAQLTDDSELVADAEKRYISARIDRKIAEIRNFVRAGHLKDAREQLDLLNGEYPAEERLKEVRSHVSRLEKQEQLYKQAVQCHGRNEREKALVLLLEVAKRGLDYRDVLERIESMSAKHSQRRRKQIATLACLFLGGVVSGWLINASINSPDSSSFTFATSVTAGSSGKNPVALEDGVETPPESGAAPTESETATTGPETASTESETTSTGPEAASTESRQPVELTAGPGLGTRTVRTSDGPDSKSGSPAARTTRPPTRTATTGVGEKPSEPRLPTTLSREDVLKTLAKDLRGLSYCGVPHLATVSMVLTITSKGVVSGGRITGTYGEDDDIADCILAKAKKIRMPNSRKGVTSLKLNFQSK